MVGADLEFFVQEGPVPKFFRVSCTWDVIQARIRMASSLLQYSDLSVRVIGESCGYGNTEHFIRQFRSLQKTTPLQFRKQFRQE